MAPSDMFNTRSDAAVALGDHPLLDAIEGVLSMYLEPQGDATDDDLTMVELLRLAQHHQGLALGLMARAEKISHCCGPHVSLRESSRSDSTIWGLTERESHVAELLSRGMSNRIIARSLKITERTVKNHLRSIFAKLDVTDRTQAVIVLMHATASDHPTQKA
jgi:DNA-binding NarL/FixJ family response regulator